MALRRKGLLYLVKVSGFRHLADEDFHQGSPQFTLGRRETSPSLGRDNPPTRYSQLAGCLSDPR